MPKSVEVSGKYRIGLELLICNFLSLVAVSQALAQLPFPLSSAESIEQDILTGNFLHNRINAIGD